MCCSSFTPRCAPLRKTARCYRVLCKVTQDTCASVSPFVFKGMQDECLSNEKTATGEKKKRGKTSNKIKDINRTKYAQEISSEIKDGSIITMSKTCRAHQNRMVHALGEFCRKKLLCGKLSACRVREGHLFFIRGGQQRPHHYSRAAYCCLTPHRAAAMQVAQRKSLNLFG